RGGDPITDGRRPGAIGQVDREAGEDETANEIAERDRDLVPQPPITERHLGAHQHARGNDEHIDDSVLEALGEEDEDGQPRRTTLPTVEVVVIASTTARHTIQLQSMA